MVYAEHDGLFVRTLEYLTLQRGENDAEDVDLTKFDQLVEEIILGNSVILSSSEFLNLNSASMTALQQILQGHDVTILAFHREPLEHLRSLWSKHNKFEQSPVPFDKWTNENLPLLPSLNMISILDQFSEAFGKESIRLYSFEGALKHSNPFSIFITDLLHLPLDGFNVAYEISERSPPSMFIETIAFISRFSAPAKSCMRAWDLSKIKTRESVVRSLPRECNSHRALQQLLGIDEKHIFEIYGKPIYYQDKTSTPRICLLDLDKILSDPVSYTMAIQVAERFGRC
mmetsp:Transcript_23836/g.32532  ORF Transcript_23836/g.32532 Transcript_23836/m.32532 type:complete len:286 (-) Transcript_23836:129-986(-)|eukprot:CAMPEP_0201486592 /NCGR_PEP_ID=MMETSP0151_2-20130828/10658_1 /ASSEMBLY_ACC=CAM_ASM_000257 /TAXON_ID=200890 /ORGANISM="Paramoeba atlantica, Strain 621/1 / CCAP 1560/9" /LENGTH=285 /DNA_ID=CAMNT_0047871321 /DNA_START=528 /DNA_END=1385 /DNA_ORIENTATION=-